MLDYNRDYLIKNLDKDFKSFKTTQTPKQNEISFEDHTREMELDLLSIKQSYLSDLDYSENEEVITNNLLRKKNYIWKMMKVVKAKK